MPHQGITSPLSERPRNVHHHLTLNFLDQRGVSMAGRSLISYLPETIREALRERIVSAGHSRFEEHEQWLKEQGFEISKSAIHRYSRTMRTDEHGDSGGVGNDTALRMRCLEVAVHRPPEVDLIGEATPLLFWVKTGQRIEGGEQ